MPTQQPPQQRIIIACPDCSATGLYRGFAEGPGKAVVCMGCQGQGWKPFLYQPFTGRQPRQGIQSVQLSQGRALPTGVGGTGEPMTYQQFLKAFPVSVPG